VSAGPGTALPSEVDVLVLGFGAAGASAAIAAADAGATVAVAEKTARGGGNCPHSGGFLFDVDEPVAVDHLDALCFGKTDRAVLQAFAAGLHEVPDWLESLGGRADPCPIEAFGGMLPSWPSFPGAGHVHYRQFVPGPAQRPGPALWATLERAVAEREVPVRTGARAVELIVEDGTVRGAVVESAARDAVVESAARDVVVESAGGSAADRTHVSPGSGRQTVRARGGVVLASGSFEADPLLRDTYLPLPLVSVGHQGNTGDTLALATGAGAALWHMSAFFGWFAFAHPEFEAAFPLDVHGPSFVYIDADGRRFADETGWEVHDKVRSMTAYLPRRANRPHLPGFLVFDERARLAGPLNGIVGTPNDYAWSADNSAELERGWIRRGDSAVELAAAIGLDPRTLQATIDAYGAAVAAGRDADFGRAARTLVALEPPLYAIEMWPAVATASGGPRRDGSARVLRADGGAIDGLYAAGAAGAVWGHLTEHGGGLTDAIVFGRIAGEGAAVGARNQTETRSLA
jgi:succinate dehydrogenase/fumarate reductase flavoprotein subunit